MSSSSLSCRATRTTLTPWFASFLARDLPMPARRRKEHATPDWFHTNETGIHSGDMPSKLQTAGMYSTRCAGASPVELGCTPLLEPVTSPQRASYARRKFLGGKM